MAEYSKAELKAFQEKDLRMVRMNCLNRAVDYMTSPKVNIEGLTNEDVVIIIKDLANEFVDWVYQDMVNPIVDKLKYSGLMDENILPEPTVKQLDILKEIAFQTQVEIEKVKEEIYKWKGAYPSKKNSVVKCVEYLKGNKNE